MSLPRLKRSVKSTQVQQHLLAARVDVSAVTTASSTAGLLAGQHDMTVGLASDDFTFTYNRAFGKKPVITATAVHATIGCRVAIKSESTTGCVLRVYGSSTTALSTVDFSVQIVGSYSSDEF